MAQKKAVEARQALAFGAPQPPCRLVQIPLCPVCLIIEVSRKQARKMEKHVPSYYLYPYPH